MDKLKRLLELAKRTGERLIILNESLDDGFVILPFDEYEKLKKTNVSASAPAEHKKSPQPPTLHPQAETREIAPQTPDAVEIPVRSNPVDSAKSYQPSQKIVPIVEEEERFYLEPLE